MLNKYKTFKDHPVDYFDLYDSSTYSYFIGEDVAPSVFAPGPDFYTWNTQTMRYDFVCSLSLLPYSYKAYTGHVLPNIHVDSINATTARLRKRCEAGMYISEQHLNDRHRLFNSYARVGV